VSNVPECRGRSEALFAYVTPWQTVTPIAAITGARGRTPTRKFLRLASHFLFAYRFCRVRRPNGKGHVEAMVGFARRNVLVTVPAAESWEALNAELVRRCQADLARRVRGKEQPKGALLAAERAALRPIPASWFAPRRVELGQANSLSLVRFDGNDYSVPTAYAHHPITVVGGLDEVRLVCQDHLVARHRRHWGKEHVPFDPVHYLALLERKPGAFDHACWRGGRCRKCSRCCGGGSRRPGERPGCDTSSRCCGSWMKCRSAN
jgi:hypothetical protein